MQITRTHKTIFDTDLEAKWADFFDLLGWQWAYKPSGLTGAFLIPFRTGPLWIVNQYVAPPNFLHEATNDVVRVGKDETAITPPIAPLLITGSDAYLVEERFSLGAFCNAGVGDGTIFCPCYVDKCPHCGKYFYWNKETPWECQSCGKDTGKPYYLKSLPTAQTLFYRIFE